MKNLKILSITAVCALLFVVMQACSFSTANMSSLKTSKDKEGKQETTSFKGGDTIYARAQISNNGGKVKVKFSLSDPSGKAVPGADVAVDIEDDGVATYSLPSGSSMSGSYKLTADMLNENGEKKDSKTATLALTAGAPTETAAPVDAPTHDDDK